MVIGVEVSVLIAMLFQRVDEVHLLHARVETRLQVFERLLLIRSANGVCLVVGQADGVERGALIGKEFFVCQIQLGHQRELGQQLAQDPEDDLPVNHDEQSGQTPLTR